MSVPEIINLLPYKVPPACSGSAPGSAPVQAARRRPNKTPEPPQLAPFNANEQQLCSQMTQLLILISSEALFPLLMKMKLIKTRDQGCSNITKSNMNIRTPPAPERISKSTSSAVSLDQNRSDTVSTRDER